MKYVFDKSKISQLICDLRASKNITKSLVVKNLVGHYKNSILGFAWHFINPIIMLAVYYFIFTEIRHTDIEQNWIFIASGLFTFNFILTSITTGSGCIVSNANMIKKMYFPRYIIPLAQIISSFIITLIGYFVIFFGIIIAGWPLSIEALIYFPLVLILSIIFSTGCILLFSSITVYVRDMQYLLNSISMVFYFMTPMYFIAEEATGLIKNVIWYNPFTYFVEICHDSIYWGRIPDTNILIICTIVSFISIIIGTIVFSKLKHGFAERL